MTIDIQEFNKIIKREESLRDQLPEHTLDWYTYTNRITLLNEVKSLFQSEVLGSDYKAPVPSPKAKPTPPPSLIVTDGQVKVEEVPAVTSN